MVAVEPEPPVVIERGRLPRHRRVALGAAQRAEAAVQRPRWPLMTGDAGTARRRGQRFMAEPCPMPVAGAVAGAALRRRHRLVQPAEPWPGRRGMTAVATCLHSRLQQAMAKGDRAVTSQRRAGMVGVTGHAIGLLQLLVKGDVPARQRRAPGGEQPDLPRRMAGDAARCLRAPERRMTGEAVVGDCRMSGHDRAGRNHYLWVSKAQDNDSQQSGRDGEDAGPNRHCQSQNSAVATRWAVASTAKASVTGTCTTFHCRTRS